MAEHSVTRSVARAVSLRQLSFLFFMLI